MTIEDVLIYLPQEIIDDNMTWSGNGLVPSGNKPSPDSKLTQLGLRLL